MSFTDEATEKVGLAARLGIKIHDGSSETLGFSVGYGVNVVPFSQYYMIYR